MWWLQFDCHARMKPRLMDDSVVSHFLRANIPAFRHFLEVAAGTQCSHNYDALLTHFTISIHRFASLDLGMLATSFCLLRLPKMPELTSILQKHKGKLPHFVPAVREVDIFAIPFTDKAREQARQKRLKEVLATGGKNAQSLKVELRKAEKEQKEKDRRQKALEKGRNPDKKRGRQAQIADEWEDLAKEERLVKKLRRGKITQAEFNAQMNEV
jgi:ATP-dependent RNA helicase DDX55/SPB4